MERLVFERELNEIVELPMESSGEIHFRRADILKSYIKRN